MRSPSVHRQPAEAVGDAADDADADAPPLRDGPATDGPTPPAEDDDELALPVGAGVGVDPGDAEELVRPGELGDALPVGGAVVGGALVGCEDGPDVEPLPPRSVTTAPPGAKVTVLVHAPDGAALVTEATIVCTCPPASVPEC